MIKHVHNDIYKIINRGVDTVVWTYPIFLCVCSCILQLPKVSITCYWYIKGKAFNHINWWYCVVIQVYPKQQESLVISTCEQALS